MIIGNISQWGEVKKKSKDKARTKGKESFGSGVESSSLPTRGTRSRGGLENIRGSRTRGNDRGRGLGRGSRGGAAIDGLKAAQSSTEHGAEGTLDGLSASLTTENKGSWDNAADTMQSSWDQPDQLNQPSARSPDASSWEIVAPGEENLPTLTEPAKPSSKPDGTRSWASMFKKPDPPVVQPKAAPSHALAPQEPIEEPEITPKAEPVMDEEPGLPPPLIATDPAVETPASPPSSSEAPLSDPALELTPSKDELTETNVEQLPDVSTHPPTATAASTVATTHDPHSTIGTGNATPAHSTQQQRGTLRPGLGGFATSAQKATSGTGRSSSFQRRVLEQQEAVVMPSNHALDRTAVQFGSMGLGAAPEDLDVDEEREEAETRTQPPQHSPVAPRATLPPAPQQQPVSENYTTTKPAPGLPPAVQQLPPPVETEQPAPQSSTPAAPAYNQFSGRYGPSVTQPDVPAPVQKTYEPFGQQVQPHAQPGQYDSYAGQSQAHPTSQAPQPQPNTYSSSANAYYSNNADNQRSMYQNYYANYGQPVHHAAQQNVQDTSVSQQPRSDSTYGTSAADQAPQYATSQGQQQASQYRYGQVSEAQASENSTPNLLLSGHQSHGHGQQSHHVPQPHAPGQVGGQHGGYPYGQPYYNHPYYGSYASQVSHHHQYGRERPLFDDVRRSEEQYLTYGNQYGYGAGQGGYGGAPYGNKQGMYGQPHQAYGMSPQTSYEQQSQSPANTGAYGQQSMPGRDNLGSLGSYGRSGSANPTDNQTAHASNSGTFGSMPDTFSRTQSGFSGANQAVGQQASGQGANDDASRSFGDSSKVAGGPSPAPGQATGRPGSATNHLQSQTGMPSQHAGQQGQQGYGGYPSHMNHQMHGQQNSHYGSGPGAPHQSGAQTHQAYGGYAGGFGGSYYGNNTRGGWGANYGH